MENRNLKLVKNRKQKKYNKAIFFLCLIAVLGIGIYFLITDFSIQNIEVKGNTTYTDAEIINAVKSQDYVDNTLVMIAQNQVFGQTYLPFIENISMGYDKSHTLKIKVKEKLRAGVFEYMNKNVYFNSEGIALESRNQLFDGVSSYHFSPKIKRVNSSGVNVVVRLSSFKRGIWKRPSLNFLT